MGKDTTPAVASVSLPSAVRHEIAVNFQHLVLATQKEVAVQRIQKKWLEMLKKHVIAFFR